MTTPGPTTLDLFPIERDGRAPLAASRRLSAAAEPHAKWVGEAMAELYRATVFEPPWIGYLAARGDELVGTGGFKSPPREGRVEIAYFTFPEYERQGVATALARSLVEVARAADPTLVVFAQTLLEENASARLLKRLGFAFVGTVRHPEDGDVWEWELTPPRAPSPSRPGS